jgi:hypothetical protein
LSESAVLCFPPYTEGRIACGFVEESHAIWEGFLTVARIPQDKKRWKHERLLFCSVGLLGLIGGAALAFVLDSLFQRVFANVRLPHGSMFTIAVLVGYLWVLYARHFSGDFLFRSGSISRILPWLAFLMIAPLKGQRRGGQNIFGADLWPVFVAVVAVQAVMLILAALDISRRERRLLD